MKKHSFSKQKNDEIKSLYGEKSYEVELLRKKLSSLEKAE